MRLEHGNAYDLMPLVDDGSVTAIITDPLYSRYKDYKWLNEIVAPRVLKPHGNLIAFTNQKHLIPCAIAANLQTAHTLTVFKQTHGALSGSAIDKAYNAYWLGSKRTKNGKIPDAWVSNSWGAALNPPHTHKWTKNPIYIAMLIETLTNEGDTVLDPFMGSGLVPFICKRLNRACVGFEIEEKAFSDARFNLDEVALEPKQVRQSNMFC